MPAPVSFLRSPAPSSKSDPGDGNRVPRKKGKVSSSTKKSHTSLQGLRNWASLMDLDYTIDQRLQEDEKNLLGYYSNSLITIICGFQAVAGLIIIGIYLPPAASEPSGTGEFPFAIAAFAFVTILVAGRFLIVALFSEPVYARSGGGSSYIPIDADFRSHALLVEDYIDPGAGLRSLADIWQDSDAIYDDLFKDPLGDTLANVKVPMVRTYGGNNRAILNAYYIWIHPYFPIMPPPKCALTADQVVPLLESQGDKLEEPCSAISRAISAILALIPCPEDRNPLDPDAVAWRRKYSQFLAKSALESLESEDERPESSVEPSKALEDSDDDVSRERFHPDVAVGLESIIALDLLSVYEYAQRVFIEAQQAILAATQFVIDLNNARRAQSDMSHIVKRMQELERYLEPLIAKSETWGSDCPQTQPVDNREMVVSQSLRLLESKSTGTARSSILPYFQGSTATSPQRRIKRRIVRNPANYNHVAPD
ncbi:hypothetical protein DL764_000077 [Monosporascus ibericus]|uniref:Uncharacterized protein n=1 Tax=Monosporascus ibericus TaxID=155417 RepID=A0A4Q4U0D8_9PEZI|nr:hypothetical protein DL764_000077 [Monosporascus ibericus]